MKGSGSLRVFAEIDDELRERAVEGLLQQFYVAEAKTAIRTRELEEEQSALRGELGPPSAAPLNEVGTGNVKPFTLSRVIQVVGVLIMMSGAVQIIWALTEGGNILSGLVGGVVAGAILVWFAGHVIRRNRGGSPSTGDPS